MSPRIDLKLWSRFLLLLAFLLPPALPSSASVLPDGSPFPPYDPFGLSPFLDWKTIETEHFRITFPEELAEVGQKVAQYYEEAHSFLSPLLRWQPTYRPQVLVIDNSDIPNGLTAATLRIGMVLWATPFENTSGLAFYDNWLRLLVIHEYTHFLNIDATSGYAEILRTVFGDVILPNSLWPAWMLEGLAVYMETRFTTVGRGRSNYYDMLLRSAVAEGVFDTPEFMQLDQINGTNPYFPGGDTRYQFGYHLMNELSHQLRPGFTADGKQRTSGGEDVFGILSERSSHRIPFFINGNLKNVTGADWQQLWNQWAFSTHTRLKSDLQKLKTEPFTPYRALIENSRIKSGQTFGVAASPDGKWLAYSLYSTDQPRTGLFLRNLTTQETIRIENKPGGVAIKFTPDSKHLIFSEVNRLPPFLYRSDLWAYSLATKNRYSLTYNQRTKDPDVSPDGKWVTFSLTEPGRTGLGIAPLIQEEEECKLGPIEKLYFPHLLDRLSNPQFSRDGKKIFFTLHTNGKGQEDLWAYDRESQKTEVLVADGNFNRFPAVDGQGHLYFVSNLGGVDNLYRYEGHGKTPSRMTHFISGLTLPSFRQSEESSTLYASLFSTSGWTLAEVQLPRGPLSPRPPVISTPPAPPIGTHSKDLARQTAYPVQNYSIFPSIYPRAWAPILGFDSQGITAGGQVLGFDAIDRHRYLLAGLYSSQFQLGDYYALYSNRSLGPDLSFSSRLFTQNINATNDASTYNRDAKLQVSLAFPLMWTFSTLTPKTSVSAQQSTSFATDSNFGDATALVTRPWIGTVDQTFTFSNALSSTLAVSSEKGRITQLGARLYLLPEEQVWKGLFIDREYFSLLDHVVLSPSVKSSYVTHTSLSYPGTRAALDGRSSGDLLGAFSGDDFDQFAIRGYPRRAFLTRWASTAAVDLRFPIKQIFRGWGTNPVFLDNFYGFVFAETSFLARPGATELLPSGGGGLRLTTELLLLSEVTFSLEYHKGFRQDLGGQGDLFFQILLQVASI